MFSQWFRKGPLPPLNRFDEFHNDPERFDLVQAKGNDCIPVIRAIRKSTGKPVAEQIRNPLVQIDQYPECFEFIESTDENNIKHIRIVRKASGEVVAERHDFSRRTDITPTFETLEPRGDSVRRTSDDVTPTLPKADGDPSIVDLAGRMAQGKSRRELLAAFAPNDFANPSDYVRFLGTSIGKLGLTNEIEKSALTFEPCNGLSESETKAVLTRLAPPDVTGEELARLGIIPVSIELLTSYLPATRSWSQQCFDLLQHQDFVLCDPYYCSALFFDGARWRQPPIAMDWLDVRQAYLPPELVQDYFVNPSAILNEGAAMGATFLREIYGAKMLTDAAEGAVPQLEVHSRQEFEDICGAIQALSRHGSKIKIWYRGQTQEHQMADGRALVAKGLLLHREFRDASLVPADYRAIDAIYSDAERMKQFVFEVMQWHDFADSLITSVRGGSPLDHELSSKGYPGSVLQSYGFPTQSIALTRSPEVAWWFATHRSQDRSRSECFEEHQWTSDDEVDWPCIYVFLLNEELHPVVDVGSLPNAPIRASRQEAGTLGNGGMLLRNGPARYVALKLRLHPGLGVNRVFKTDDLFPSTSEDELLTQLLPWASNLSYVPLRS
jgi:hypothetical protein